MSNTTSAMRIGAEELLRDYEKGEDHRPDVMLKAQAGLVDAIDQLVQKYGLGTTKEFRVFMKDNDLIISGSTALHIFQPHFFEPSDLDLYSPICSQTSTRAYLRDKGYTQEGSDKSPYEFENASIACIERYRLADNRIDVIYSKTSTAIQIVPEFHTSLVMNYVAWYGAACLYPGTTLRACGIENAATKKATECIERYKARGFQFFRSLLRGPYGEVIHPCRRDFHCPSALRSLHDSGVLFIPFKDTSRNLALYEAGLLWRLNNNTCGAQGHGFTVSAIGECATAERPPVEAFDESVAFDTTNVDMDLTTAV